MSISSVLRGHNLFGALTSEEVHAVSDFSSVKKYSQGEMIFKHEKAGTHVFLLLGGEVDLRLPAQAPRYSIVVSRIEKGEIFGISPLLGSKFYTASAHCESECEALVIEARPFRELLKKNCPIGFHIMSQVAQIYFQRYIEIVKNFQSVVSQIPLIR